MTKINSIYIIDDDAIVLFGIKKLLRKIVVCDSIFEFNNGKLALNALMHQIERKQIIPDVIFLDINMPIMDGWEFLNEFLKLPIDKKIIINIITSSIDPSDKKRWMPLRNTIFNSKTNLSSLLMWKILNPHTWHHKLIISLFLNDFYLT